MVLMVYLLQELLDHFEAVVVAVALVEVDDVLPPSSVPLDQCEGFFLSVQDIPPSRLCEWW